MPTLNEALVISIEGDSSKYVGTLKTIETKTKSATANMARGFKDVADSLAKIGVAGLALFGGGGALSLKKFADAEDAFAELAGLFTEGIDQLQDYKKAIDSISSAMGIRTVETTEAFYQSVSAGFRTIEDATQVVEAASKAAIAGGVELPIAVEAITRVLNAYSFEGSQAQMVSDKLFQTINYGKTEFKELAPQIGLVAGTAAKAGVPLDDLMATIATISKLFPTPETIVSINAILNAFIKPTPQIKEAAASMKDLSISFELATIRERGLVGVMQELARLSSEQLAQLFPNVRGMRGALAALTEQGAVLGENLKLIQNAIGATSNAFEKRSSTLKFVMNRIKVAVEQVFEAIGEALKTDAQDFIKWLEDVVPKVKAFIIANAPLASSIIKWGTAISGALISLKALAIVFSPGAKLIKGLALFGKGITMLVVSKFGLLVSGIAAVGAAMIGLVAMLDPRRAKELWGNFRTGVEDAALAMSGMGEKIGIVEKNLRGYNDQVAEIELAGRLDREKDAAEALAVAQERLKKAEEERQRLMYSTDAAAKMKAWDEYADAMRAIPEAEEAHKEAVKHLWEHMKKLQDGTADFSYVMDEVVEKVNRLADTPFEGLGKMFDKFESFATDMDKKFGEPIRKIGIETAQEFWRAFEEEWPKTAQYVLNEMMKLKQQIENLGIFANILGPTGQIIYATSKQHGGLVEGPWNNPQPVLAHAGEMVMNPAATAAYYPFLNQMNQSIQPGQAYYDASTTHISIHDRITKTMVRDNLIPQLSDARKAGYGIMHRW